MSSTESQAWKITKLEFFAEPQPLSVLLGAGAGLFPSCKVDGAGSTLCLAALLCVDGLMVGWVVRKEDTCLGDLQDLELGLTPLCAGFKCPGSACDG